MGYHHICGICAKRFDGTDMRINQAFLNTLKNHYRFAHKLTINPGELRLEMDTGAFEQVARASARKSRMGRTIGRHYAADLGGQ